MSRRVLLVAYYFPPLGLSGVQRVAKFAKYLPEFDWHVTVLTIHPKAYFAFDESLLKELDRPGIEILRTATLDPTRLPMRKRVNLPGESRRRRFSAISQMVFQPDNKIGWYPFAVHAGKKAIRKNHHDAVISSAPPYTGHLAGARIARAKKVPLVVDYRDDWLDNPRHDYPTERHRRIAERMERYVFKRTQATLAINERISQRIRRRSEGLLGPDVHHVLPHGFDPEDFNGQLQTGDSDHMNIVYTGIFYDAQKPDVFLRGLSRFVTVSPQNRKRIRATFYGLLPESATRLIQELGLADIVDFRGYVSHDDAVRAMREADVLWMTIGRRAGAAGISTGKLYEYFGARKPILALVPDGVAKDSLMEYDAGEIVAPDEPDAVAVSIGKLFMQWESRRFATPNEAFVTEHDRRVLAARLADILNNVTKSTPR